MGTPHSSLTEPPGPGRELPPKSQLRPSGLARVMAGPPQLPPLPVTSLPAPPLLPRRLTPAVWASGRDHPTRALRRAPLSLAFAPPMPCVPPSPLDPNQRNLSRHRQPLFWVRTVPPGHRDTPASPCTEALLPGRRPAVGGGGGRSPRGNWAWRAAAPSWSVERSPRGELLGSVQGRRRRLLSKHPESHPEGDVQTCSSGEGPAGQGSRGCRGRGGGSPGHALRSARPHAGGSRLGAGRARSAGSRPPRTRRPPLSPRRGRSWSGWTA